MERLPVGRILQRLRKAKGMTQEQMGEALGVSNAAVSKWENGQMYPDISMLPILARFFDVSIDCLIGFTSEMSNEEYKQYKVDCIALFESSQYLRGVEKIKAICRLYPANDDMKLELIMCALPHMAFAGDASARSEAARQLVPLCQSCPDSSPQKPFLLVHLYMMMGDYEKASLNAARAWPKAKNAGVDVTNAIMLKMDAAVADENIDSKLTRLGAQLIFELRNKMAGLVDMGDLRGALDVLERQRAIVEALDMDISLHMVLAMNRAYINCARGNLAAAKQDISELGMMLKAHPTMDELVLDALRTGVNSQHFGLLECEPELSELKDMLS